MTLRFIDGFDHLALADLGIKWNSVFVSSMQTGRFGGQCVRMSSTGGTIVKILDNLASWVVGFAFRMTSQLPGSTVTILSFKDAGTLQCELNVKTDGTLSVTRNGTAVTGGTSTLAISLNTWYYVEMKVTIADSIAANSCKVRVGGVDWITVATGQDLKNTANATANQITFGTTSNSSAFFDCDDVYVCDSSGSVNNDFLGEVRVETLYPTGAGATTQLTDAVSSHAWGQTVGTTQVTTGLGANTLVYIKVTAPFTGTASQVQATLTNNVTGKVNLAIYSDSGAISPNTLLAQATELTNPVIGAITFTLQSPIAVTRNVNYWFAMWSNANVSTSFVGQATANVSQCTQGLTYSATFPSNATPGTVSAANTPTLIADMTGVTNYTLVSETLSDGDTGCVTTSTVGQKDTYQMGNLSSTPVSIFGVQTSPVVRKTDAGTHTFAAVVRSGGTNFDGTAIPLLDSYVPALDVRETDPATGSAWSAGGVNAMEAGVKLVS